MNFVEAEKYIAMTYTIDVSNCNPLLIANQEYVLRYVTELCDSLDTKPNGESILTYFDSDKKGFSVVQITQDGIITCHSIIGKDIIHVDIFSYKNIDSLKTTNFTVAWFEGSNRNTNILYRK